MISRLLCIWIYIKLRTSESEFQEWESYQYSRAKTMRHELLASWLHQFDWTLDLVFWSIMSLQVKFSSRLQNSWFSWLQVVDLGVSAVYFTYIWSPTLMTRAFGTGATPTQRFPFFTWRPPVSSWNSTVMLFGSECAARPSTRSRCGHGG